MKSEHTPGPWKIDEASDLPLAVIRDNEDGEGIAEIGNPDSRACDATETQLADARLISAAPELLKALQDLVETCEAASGCSDNGYCEFDLDEAHAAIAKATDNSN